MSERGGQFVIALLATVCIMIGAYALLGWPGALMALGVGVLLGLGK